MAELPLPAGFDRSFTSWRQRVDTALQLALQAPDDLRLHAAMRHAVLLGGKRIRPLLVYATGTFCGAVETTLDAPAVAVELIHAYSLVHDDLPAMDNDTLRRGQPTVHVAFDEATAILCGDALQSLAFQQLADAPLSADARVAMIRELAIAAGANGMCGGQAIDIEATGHSEGIQLPQLERLHALKTGALLRASVRLGAITGEADEPRRQALDRYADALGLAFQIRDDLLDIEANSATLGKTAGKDLTQNKATFPALIGIEQSRERLQELHVCMQLALSPFGSAANALLALAERVVVRNH